MPLSYEKMPELIMAEAKKAFRPEFLNRLDDVIVFHALDKQALMKILDLEIGKVVERLEKKDINLVLDEKARDFLVEKGHDPEYGARPLRRAVQTTSSTPRSHSAAGAPSSPSSPPASSPRPSSSANSS